MVNFSMEIPKALGNIQVFSQQSQKHADVILEWSLIANGIVDAVSIGQQNRVKVLQFLETSILTLINYFEHQKQLL